MTQALQNTNQLANIDEPPMDDKEDTHVDSMATIPGSKSAAPSDSAEVDKMQVEVEEIRVNTTIYKPGIITESNQSFDLSLLTQAGRKEQVSQDNRLTFWPLTAVNITEVHQTIKKKDMDDNACKSSVEQHLKNQTETENGLTPLREEPSLSQNPQNPELSLNTAPTQNSAMEIPANNVMPNNVHTPLRPTARFLHLNQNIRPTFFKSLIIPTPQVSN
ncbi:hypothetical protein Salat_2655500 [Sesamum alatum]|uniref:Uncharacterized protein n=1 Tax=Sesamum alatum TaxID=300844 RepID=A0AAE1XP99_9LAMI|nr:hypothetical protein Salat_2655500 [Sesamum alatum]